MEILANAEDAGPEAPPQQDYQQELTRTTNDHDSLSDAEITRDVDSAPVPPPKSAAHHLTRELEARIERFSVSLRDHVALMVSETQANGDRKHAKEMQELLAEKMRDLNEIGNKYSTALHTTTALERELKRTHASGRATADLLRTYKDRLAVSHLKQRSFLLWKRQFDAHIRLLELERVWAIPHHRRSRTSRTFSAWRNLAHKRQKRADFERWKAHVEQVSCDLINTYEAKLVEMRSQLNLAQCELSELHESRAMAEQDMRRAFMRGVSALNLEAMSMFARGQDHENEMSTANMQSQKSPSGHL